MEREKGRDVVAFCENQTDDEAIADAEAAYRKRTCVLIDVPVKLLAQVRRILARMVIPTDLKPGQDSYHYSAGMVISPYGPSLVLRFLARNRRTRAVVLRNVTQH